ncbi:MAG: peptide deformylase [Candidatus Dormibacteria bacterium]
MAVLTIITQENPHIRRKANRVPRVDASVQKLMDDLLETMLANNGVGLAAVQVDVPLRVIVVKVDNQVFQLANPEMVRAEGEQIGYEGCLSVPGMIGEVARAERVVVKGLNRHGKEVRIKGSELLARAFQHEIDHLDGILFLDKLTSIDTLRKVDDLADEDRVDGEGVTLAV